MIANSIKKIIFALVLMTTPLSSFADGNSSQNSNQPANGTAVLKLVAKYPNKRRAPSMNFLEVFYSDGLLSLTSNIYEGVFSICFENYESGEKYVIPAMWVGETIDFDMPIGEYIVTAEGENGISFTGIMSLM